MMRQTYAVAGMRIAERCVGDFSFVDSLQWWNECILDRLTAIASAHVRSATALTREHIAVIVHRAARITVAGRASILAIGQAERLWHTLIAVFSRNQALAHTLASMLLASGIVDGSESVAGTTFTTLWIGRGQIPESIFACVTLAADNVCLAMASTSFDGVHFVAQRIANAFVQRTLQITIACCK